ncbi:RNA polymerase III-inhibiting protein maf1 [Dimargaris verticillata]|uniref:Repressor of RNA polymerase III transcription MAF1 n=1 Tax=Dimargaris verticillata TaxID=2761393 RepID=A0A9W8B4Q7_9FUNG|nr:RNA polymerase III-inhibiting protein maf1 [Dimargaris verticillata]
MKYLEIPDFDVINAALNFETAGDAKLQGRVEAYTCKLAGTDKKLFKCLENKFQEDLEAASSLSPEQSLSHMISPFGPLTEAASRRVLFYLIATLNASFPDYDFRFIKPEQFTHEPDAMTVIKSINSTLFTVGDTSVVQKYRLWEAVDKVVELNNCAVYSYCPDMDSDPFAENNSIWSYHYFFFNRQLKRLVYFNCECQGLASYSAGEDEEGYPMDAPNFPDFSDDEEYVMCNDGMVW